MSSDFSVLFKKFLFKIVTFAEQIKHGIDQVFVIQTFEFHFIQIEIFGNDPQDMNRQDREQQIPDLRIPQYREVQNEQIRRTGLSE